MGKSRNVGMPECGSAVECHSRFKLTPNFGGVLRGLPRMLMSRRMSLFSMLFANIMGMRRAIL